MGNPARGGEFKEVDMKFKITSKGKVIAIFLFESDRDICLDALREAYEDVIFEAKDE